MNRSNFNDVKGNQYNTTYVTSSLEDDDKVLATLSAVAHGWDPPKCMKGTRKGVFEEINGWLGNDDSPNILWICGSPGAGKSAIASTLISDLMMQGRLASRFCFKRGDASLSDPVAVWRTVASDLAVFDAGFKASLVEVLKETRVDPGNADIELHFKCMIEGPLTEDREKLSVRHPVIVFDALDECGSHTSQSAQGKIFLDTLTTWSRLPPGLKLIVTGRDERVPKSFRDGDLVRRILLPTGWDVNSDSEVSNDIRLFLETRFADIQERFPSLPYAWPGNATIERLMTRAAGLFIWAETVMKFVEDEESNPEIRLDLVLAENMGEGARNIDALYSQILTASFGRSDDTTVEVFRAVVGAIILAKTPIHRGDLNYYLSRRVNETQIDLVLYKLASVISIGKLDKLLRISHLSFAEYLCDRHRCLEGFHIDRSVQSCHLVLACLRLMKGGLKFNICNLKTSHLRNEDVADLAGCIHQSIPAHLSYSCRFWVQHLRDTDKERDHDTMLNMIHNFLYTRLLYWLEVMSLIREIPMAIAALLAVAQWIAVSFMQCHMETTKFDPFLPEF